MSRAFICRHQDPRCEDDPCPAGIQWLCDAPDDSPLRQSPEGFTLSISGTGEGDTQAMPEIADQTTIETHEVTQ